MSDLRSKADQMIWDYRNAVPYSTDTQIALMVFEATWSQAHTIEQINRIGGALANLPGNADLQAVCTAMVKAKLLRTKRQNGQKLYELNY